MRSIGLILFRYLLVGCAIAAAFYSLLLARAAWLFRQDTAASVPAAVRLVPYNAAYVARLAAWQSSEKVALLHRAVKLNPFDFESWIHLGFASEFQQHDRVSAERYYLKAAEVNKMFLPRWTLANFYFRQQRAAEFFRWANATLAVTPYSPEPVFVQMWLMGQDPASIMRALPERPAILLAYAWFLSNRNQYSSISQVVERLIRAAGNRNPRAWGRDDLLAAIEDRLLAEGHREPALSIWADIVRAGWLHGLIPSAAHPLTNGDFRTTFFRHGFDWTPVSSECARVEESPSERLVRLRFSGDQPETCVVLQQFLPLEAGRAYRLEWNAESQLADAPSGLVWRLRPPGHTSGDLFSSQRGKWTFQSPDKTDLALLTLEYSRPLGQVRMRGTVTLRSVSCSLE